MHRSLHRSLYQSSVGLFKDEKYQILTAELCHPLKSFNKKFDIYEIYHKHLNKNQFPCEAVCNKVSLDPIPHEFKDLRKNPNFQANLVKENRSNV